MLMGLAPALHEAVDGDPGRVTAEIMGEISDQDEPVRQAILHAGSYVAIGVANIVTSIHPELIVIGGGVAKLGEILLGRIREDVHKRIGKLMPIDDLRIENSKLGSKAGVLGAIALASRGLPE